MGISKEILERFNYNKIYVETGTGLGVSAKAAIDAGFKSVFTFEAYRKTYIKASQRLKDHENIVCLPFNSGTHLLHFIAKIEVPITFFLDAHYMKTFDTPKQEFSECPLLDEIAQIASHPIKTHTILIDDRRLFEKERWGISLIDVYEALNKIGKYRAGTVDCTYRGDIIVADFRKD